MTPSHDGGEGVLEEAKQRLQHHQDRLQEDQVNNVYDGGEGVLEKAKQRPNRGCYTTRRGCRRIR